ncbi:MAG: hypothetical protein GQ564_06960 [Bacteroidales bacterium]|nr:hypothetical protein [Bacteroidales bacterium]
MRKKIIFLTVTFLLLILSVKKQYGQTGSEYSRNIEISLCNSNAFINVNVEISYKFSGYVSNPDDKSALTGGFWDDGLLKMTFKTSSVSNYINLDGKQIATSSINGFNENVIKIMDLYADVYSGANKINNIKIGIDYSQAAKLNGIPKSVINSINWTQIFNTDNKEEIIRIFNQGFTLKNFTFTHGFSEPTKFIATPKSSCSQLNKIGINDKYNSTVAEADNLLRSGQHEEAEKKYKEASKLKPNEQYPKEKINKIQKIQSQQNLAENTSSEPEIIDEPDNDSDETSYSSSTSNSSSESSQYSNNSNNNQQAQKQQRIQATINQINRSNAQTESNVQSIYQTADKLSVLVGNAFAQQNAQAEYEREREAELKRDRMEEERIEREIEMAWNSMSEFENDFNSYFRKNMSNVMSKKCLYFYYGNINKYREDKSGNLKLSNIFPVYCNADGTWPYISDITNKIKAKNGNVIIRGYFLTETDAIRDKNSMTSKAHNSYINNINSKAYYFSFNEPTESTNQNTDFWGNEKTENTNNSQKDFWGNEPSTNKSTNTQTDFWGNKVDTLKTKQDSLKTKPKNDFWK